MYKSQFRKIDPGFVVQGHKYKGNNQIYIFKN